MELPQSFEPSSLSPFAVITRTRFVWSTVTALRRSTVCCRTSALIGGDFTHILSVVRCGQRSAIGNTCQQRSSLCGRPLPSSTPPRLLTVPSIFRTIGSTTVSGMSSVDRTWSVSSYRNGSSFSNNVNGCNVCLGLCSLPCRSPSRSLHLHYPCLIP